MSNDENLLNIVKSVLSTFDYRQSYTPGMFEPLKPLFEQLGYESAAVYIADDYPDRMHLEAVYGNADIYPEFVPMNGHASLFEYLEEMLAHVPNALTGRLFSHGRELGALVVTGKNLQRRIARESFAILAQSMSIMAYIERIRTNCVRERQERDVFFAQSLTSRLLLGKLPKVKNLRIGVEYMRCLEAGGDFYDFVAVSPTRLRGFFGCCNGKGVRTVLEVCRIMRDVHRAAQSSDSPSAILRHVNNMLVEQNKRTHQASLCVFDIDVTAGTICLAKAGYLGLMICGPGAEVQNISTFGGLFLGMDAKPKIHDEVFDFGPGRSLFCLTEGFYTSKNCMGAQPQIHWFIAALKNTLGGKRKKPLVNQLFQNLDQAADFNTRPTDTLLALSVENTGK